MNVDIAHVDLNEYNREVLTQMCGVVVAWMNSRLSIYIMSYVTLYSHACMSFIIECVNSW
jgi:hypothetical protein